MPACAFLTIQNTDGWFIDDDLVHEPLRNLGWEIVNIPWNQKTNWNKFDVVVIRSPWDYQDHFDHFIDVLNEIESSSAILLNSMDIVKWNINKNYLFELEKSGVELVPTIRAESPDAKVLTEAFDKLQSDRLIIKPIIGANEDDTFKFNAASDLNQISEVFTDRACMIQPFMNKIVDEGEFSLMYFEGKLSHTILKTVGDGDFRVQEEHGGGVIPMPEPEPALIAAAEKAMRALPFDTMYARVDLVRTDNNSFALMELELIEPCLYFRFDNTSPGRFAQCIDRAVKR